MNFLLGLVYIVGDCMGGGEQSYLLSPLNDLSSMPIYFMSLFCMPRKVRLRLEKIQRDFLWGGGALVQKLHLVRWKTTCLEKRKGGLGVRKLSLMNTTILCNASGVGGMPMKGRHFGNMSSIKSMVKMMGGGVPARWVRGLVWGCGKLLGRSEIIWVAGWPSMWAMGREWDSR